MSILIKGMDKPTDCGLCPFEDFGYCNVKGERNTSESGIDTDCPLIEVVDHKTESISEIPNNCEDCIWSVCNYNKAFEDEPTISKMEQVETMSCQECKHWKYVSNYGWDCEFESVEDCKYEPKTEPQTNADQHAQRIEYVGNDEKSRCWTCKHFERMHETLIASDGNYYTYVVCTAKECHYEPQTEPQYDAEEVAKDINRRVDMVKKEWNARHIEDEPQTDCAWK